MTVPIDSHFLKALVVDRDFNFCRSDLLKAISIFLICISLIAGEIIHIFMFVSHSDFISFTNFGGGGDEVLWWL